MWSGGNQLDAFAMLTKAPGPDGEPSAPEPPAPTGTARAADTQPGTTRDASTQAGPARPRAMSQRAAYFFPACQLSCYPQSSHKPIGPLPLKRASIGRGDAALAQSPSAPRTGTTS
jgi:hypothetical protein